MGEELYWWGLGSNYFLQGLTICNTASITNAPKNIPRRIPASFNDSSNIEGLCYYLLCVNTYLVKIATCQNKVVA